MVVRGWIGRAEGFQWGNGALTDESIRYFEEGSKQEVNCWWVPPQMGANEGDRKGRPYQGREPSPWVRGSTGRPVQKSKSCQRLRVDSLPGEQAQKLLDGAKDHLRISVLPGSGGATAGAASWSEHHCADQAGYTHFSLELLVESRDILDWVNFLHRHRP